MTNEPQRKDEEKSDQPAEDCAVQPGSDPEITPDIGTIENIALGDATRRPFVERSDPSGSDETEGTA